MVKIADVVECRRASGDQLVYPEKGEACRDTRDKTKVVFHYVFAATADTPDKYSVIFNITDKDKNEMEQLVKVGQEYGKIVPVIDVFNNDNEFNLGQGPVKVKSGPNGIISFLIKFNSPLNDYQKSRLRAIYNWLAPRTYEPKTFAAIRIEPETKDIQPATYDIKGVRLEPGNPDAAASRGQINLFFITEKKLPSEKFSIEIIFPAGAPAELTGKFLNTLDGVKDLEKVAANKIGEDTTLSLREFKTKLDLGVAFTSSVEEKEENGINVRKRKNRLFVDLKFAPIINYPLDRNEVHLITPFFIDAKVSLDKISKDTLSLNRILIGTQYNIRWAPDTNIYTFSFRGINASDRDFKRAEAKFNFEFRPQFYGLYNPLTVQYKDPAPNSILVPENSPKQIPDRWFGYQVQPFIGFEVGRIYRAKREAFNNENFDRNLRRFFFGADLLFNITRRMNIKLSDTFYIRGETPDAKNRNYFNGELEIPFYQSGTTTQNVYLSYERGDQPPFATPSVNSLKIGYRLTTNFWGRNP